MGRILRDFGEESEWYHLQNKIAKARLKGGLHATRELVSLIKTASSKSGGTAHLQVVVCVLKVKSLLEKLKY